MTTPNEVVLKAIVKKESNAARAKLYEKRRELAEEAIEYVKTTLSWGACNALAGFSAFPKIDKVLKQYISIPEGMPLGDKKIMLTRSIQCLREKNHFVDFSPAEDKQLRAILSRCLMNTLLPKENNHSIKTLENLTFYVQLIRLFKTGVCGEMVNMVLEYLLKNHSQESAIFPLHTFVIHKKKLKPIAQGYVDPEDGHTVLFIGRLCEDDSHVGLDTYDDPDPTICDAWIGKAFLLKDWNKYASPGLQLECLDESSDKIFSIVRSQEEIESILPLLNKQFDFGVTTVEIEGWVEDLYQIFTTPGPVAKTAVAPAFPLHAYALSIPVVAGSDIFPAPAIPGDEAPKHKYSCA